MSRAWQWQVGGPGGVTLAMLLSVVVALLLVLMPGKVNAQAEPAGRLPGSYVAVGITGAGFNSGYGQQKLIGPALYVDANLYRRLGFEAEARSLRFHNQLGVRQSTYLAGVRVTARGYNVRPYTKLLAGLGSMTFPYNDAHGRYLVVAPGAGLDLRVSRLLQVRVVDVEYQFWPQFTFGAMQSWGISTGLSVRVW